MGWRYSVAMGLTAVLVLGCSGKTSSGPSFEQGGSSNNDDVDTQAGAKAEAGAGGGGGNALQPVPCQVNPSAFTACVKVCGEPDDRESTAAQCVDGFYSCPAPLVPAASCAANAWPSGPYAGCGPWVSGYNCSFRAVCDQHLWTCPNPDSADEDKCVVTACEGLDEAACSASRPTASQSGCLPARGVPYSAADGAPDQYVGCARGCCGDGCLAYPDTEVCAIDPTGACWTLNGQPVPDGWSVLSETLACYEISKCKR